MMYSMNHVRCATLASCLMAWGVVSSAHASATARAAASLDWNSLSIRRAGVAWPTSPWPTPTQSQSAASFGSQLDFQAGDFPFSTSGQVEASVGSALSRGSVSDGALLSLSRAFSPTDSGVVAIGQNDINRNLLGGSAFAGEQWSVTFTTIVSLDLRTAQLGDFAEGSAIITCSMVPWNKPGLPTLTQSVGVPLEQVANGEIFVFPETTIQTTFSFDPEDVVIYDFHFNVHTDATAYSVPAPASITLVSACLVLAARRRRSP